MADRDPFAARLVRAGARAYAAQAVTLWFEREPTAEARYAPAAFDSWRAELARLLEELAAALADGLPELFTRRVLWSREAFDARQVPLADLEAALRALGDVLEQELPPPSAPRVRPYFVAAVEALSTAAAAPGHSEGATPAEQTVAAALSAAYVAALARGDARGASRAVLEAVEHGRLDVRTALLDVLAPALREVGQQWHQGELSVGEEHFATAASRRTLHELLGRGAPAPANGRAVLVGVVAGDLHDVGAEMVAGLLELDGWRVIFLGPDMPIAGIAEAAARFEVDLVALSATLDTHRRLVAATIAALRGSGRDVAVLVGGAAFAAHETLWRNAGADAWAGSATDAVQRARELVGLPPHAQR